MVHKKTMIEMTFFGSIHYRKKKFGEHYENVRNAGFEQKDLQQWKGENPPNSEIP